VVYVDNDPLVVAHARGRPAFLEADLREPRRFWKIPGCWRPSTSPSRRVCCWSRSSTESQWADRSGPELATLFDHPAWSRSPRACSRSPAGGRGRARSAPSGRGGRQQRHPSTGHSGPRTASANVGAVYFRWSVTVAAGGSSKADRSGLSE
jgi:hypothetical protein